MLSNSSTLCKIIKEQFLQIKDAEKTLSKLSNAQCVEQITKLKEILNAPHPDLSSALNPELIPDDKEHARYLLIALANRAFIQYFNIYPNEVQIITVLGLLLPRPDLKGVLAQVGTGEGKSTIIALLSLVLAAEGKCVDIITSTPYLAKRDQVKYQDFFKHFAITTSTFSDTEIKPEDFGGQIMYGTNYNFEFSVLFDILGLANNRVLFSQSPDKRPLQVSIVDEVDNMLVDKALNSARIAYPTTQNLTTAYPIIYDYIKSNCNKNTPDLDIVNQCALLLKKYNLATGKIQRLVNSAYEACFEYQLDTHYYIKKPITQDTMAEDAMEIVIIDQDTGRLCSGSRWEHGLSIQEDTLTLGSLSHPAFFNSYAEVYGLTGSIGSAQEREEIATIYKLASFDAPTYKPPLRKQLATIVCKDNLQFKTLLLKEIKEINAQMRPCLILCPTIESSKQIHHLVAQCFPHNDSLQLLNDVQGAEEDFIVDSAGNQSSITIATNAAGRGTDIRPKQEALLSYTHLEEIDLSEDKISNSLEMYQSTIKTAFANFMDKLS